MIFIIFTLAAPRLTLGLKHEDSLTKATLVTENDLTLPKGHEELRKDFGFQSLAELLKIPAVGIKQGNF